MPPVLTPYWALIVGIGASGITCRLLDRAHWKVRALLTLGGASKLSARFHAQSLTLADDRGRLIAIDLATGEILRSLRVR